MRSIFPLLGGVLLLAGILHLGWQKQKSYDQGFDEGFRLVISELAIASQEAKDSCIVAAVPYANKKDTIVYFLTAEQCGLDSVITDRWKRGN